MEESNIELGEYHIDTNAVGGSPIDTTAQPAGEIPPLIAENVVTEAASDVADEVPADHLSKNPSVITALELIYVHDVAKSVAVDWACRNDSSVPADWGALL